MAAILIAPLVQLQAADMTNLVLAAMAAALVASFRSFPVAFAAGSHTRNRPERAHEVRAKPRCGRFPARSSSSSSWMVARGQALPLRDFFLQRLPAVGCGQGAPDSPVVALIVGALLIRQVPANWQDAFVVTFAMGLVLLSAVVLTGYAGQLSLAQFALAGFGALVAGPPRRRLETGRSRLPCLPPSRPPPRSARCSPCQRCGHGASTSPLSRSGLGTALEFLVFNNARLVAGLPARKSASRICSAGISTPSPIQIVMPP